MSEISSETEGYIFINITKKKNFITDIEMVLVSIAKQCVQEELRGENGEDYLWIELTETCHRRYLSFSK